MINKKLKLIRKISWEEAFLFWHESEGQNKSWINLAKKRGFETWADWRVREYAKPFACDQANWGLYEIKNPADIIQDFYGGPFRAWIKYYYDGKKEKKFSAIIRHKDIVKNKNIKALLKNFPKDTILIALEVEKKIYIIEGMHRLSALALLGQEKKAGPQKIYLALGKSKLKQLPIVGAA